MFEKEKNNANRKYKKILVVLCIFLTAAILKSPQYIYAEENEVLQSIVKEYIQETIERIPVAKWTIDTEISDITPTYNVEQETNGYIVALSTNGAASGYIQVCGQCEEWRVVSFAFEGEHYTSNVDSPIYYFGNLDFAYRTEDEKYRLVRDDTIILLTDDYQVVTAESRYYSEMSVYSSAFTLLPGFSGDIVVSMDDFPGYSGHCSPTAGTNLIKYWGICRGMNSLVENSEGVLTDNQIFSRLYTLMETGSGGSEGTRRKDIASGIWKYMVENSVYPSKAYYVAGSLDYAGYQESIKNGEPLILNLDSTKYGKGRHSIVGVGFVGTVAIIADGWSRSLVYIVYDELDITGHQEIGF